MDSNVNFQLQKFIEKFPKFHYSEAPVWVASVKPKKWRQTSEARAVKPKQWGPKFHYSEAPVWSQNIEARTVKPKNVDKYLGFSVKFHYSEALVWDQKNETEGCRQ